MAAQNKYHLLNQEDDTQENDDGSTTKKKDQMTINYFCGRRQIYRKDFYLIMGTFAVVSIILVALFITAAIRHQKFKHPPSQNHPQSNGSASDNSFPYKNFRLPAYIRPSHYSIDLRPKYNQLLTDGNSSINITSSKKTNFIILHQKFTTIHEVKVKDANGNSIKVVKVSQLLKYNFLYIQLENFLQPNHKYVIHLTFTSHIKTKVLHGFYRSQYRTSSGITR